MTSRNDRIPELRIGKLDGLWTVAIANQHEHGWVLANEGASLPNGTVADWTPLVVRDETPDGGAIPVGGDGGDGSTPLAASSELRATDVENAIDVVARHLICNAVFDSIKSGHTSWEDYPELAELDWEAVSARACHLADTFAWDLDTFALAYAVLAKRAKGVEA